MKITEINFQTFLSKQKYLSKTGFENMQKLLTKMNEQVIYSDKNSGTYKSQVLARIYINVHDCFFDGRWLPQKYSSQEALKKGNSMVIANKAQVKINNTDGGVKIIRNPLFKKVEDIIIAVEDVIKTGLNNFDKQDVVEKRFYGMQGPTRAGLKNL